jgi:hypothetical protein
VVKKILRLKVGKINLQFELVSISKQQQKHIQKHKKLIQKLNKNIQKMDYKCLEQKWTPGGRKKQPKKHKTNRSTKLG